MRYESPELFELGDAAKLTQFGCTGLRLDLGDFPRIFCPESGEPEDEV